LSVSNGDHEDMKVVAPQFTIHAISPKVLGEVRSSGRDVSGLPVVALTARGGEPLRCCLRNADEGEQCLLFGCEPPIPSASPYREIGAVYVHAAACDGWHGRGSYPADWADRPQVLRAYDRRGWIHPATTVHDGKDPVGMIADILKDPGVVEVHSRNIAYGCFMFSARRGAAGDPSVT
jgi:Protein of unknown function (DUF1203)